MPVITENQRAYCNIAQLSSLLRMTTKYVKKDVIFNKLLEIDDVNLKVLSHKSGKSDFFDATSLHIAGFYKSLEAFDNLLIRGADITVKNKNGDTPLHLIFNRSLDKEVIVSYVTTNEIVSNKLLQSALMAHIKFGIIKNPESADGLSHFHIACAADHLESIEFFLDAGTSINEQVNLTSTKFPGYTALHFAARFCAYAAVKLLLQRDANVNVKDAKGLTPIHVNMAWNLELPQIKKLTSKSSEIKRIDKSIEESLKITILFLNNDQAVNTYKLEPIKLHAACTLRDSSLADRFIRDVDINHAISSDFSVWPGYTALHFAAQCNIDTVKLLIQRGANIEAKDAEGVSPLDICIKKYRIEDAYDILSVVPGFRDIFFSDNKTRLSSIIYGMQSFSSYNAFFKSILKRLYLPKNCSFWPGYSVSHFAVHFSKVPGFHNAKKYISLGRNIMIKDACGRTSLHLAFYQKKYKIVDLLLQHRLGKVEVIDNDGLSNLHIACARSNKVVAQNLLAKGANVNIGYKGKRLSPIINKGSTPLHIAVSSCDDRFIKMLLEHGANANAIDVDGYTPIHQLTYLPRSITFINRETAKYFGDLLFSSCDLRNIVSKTGLSHLHVASYIGNENAVEGLLKLGADANAVFWANNNVRAVRFLGYTPIHFAVEMKNKKLVQLLLQSGADILHKKPDGMTLLYDVLTGNAFEKPSIGYKIERLLMLTVANDKTLQKRFKKDCGLTALHIACQVGDNKQIDNLLKNSRINVNAQVHACSPIWPKTTPLHIAVEFAYWHNNFSDSVWSLLHRGADITLTDDTGDTPVHVAWNHRDKYGGLSLLRSLLKYQKDFSINPANEQGISHFHVACFLREHAIVKAFLDNKIDVNLPVHYYCYDVVFFQTPLHFMIDGMIYEKTNLDLCTIDLLLKHGADVNVKNANSMTPLLKLASYVHISREMFFDKLIKAGADINCTSWNGENVLEILLDHSHRNVTTAEFQLFIGHSNLLNAYNLVYGIGIISMIARNQHQHEFNLEMIMGKPSLFIVDRIGRTPIHNIVANNTTNPSPEDFANYIGRFIEMGYDIDTQDSEGKTALHVAVDFCNLYAVSGLLIAGADVNITDNMNRTAFAITMQFTPRYDSKIYASDNCNNWVKEKMGLHQLVMLSCDLDVNCHDIKLLDSIRSENEIVLLHKAAMDELGLIKFIMIGTGSLKVRDFLSETGAVASRPSMVSETDRQAIDKFFEDINLKNFPCLRSILKLQYRKSLARLSLMQPATESLKNLVGIVNGFYMPDLCSRMIIRFLANTDVKNLINSISKDKATN